MVNERGLQSGHLHVGGGPFPAQSMLADALARFVADYPRIVVRVMMRDWDELLRRRRAREIEFLVAELSTFGTENDVDVEPLAAAGVRFLEYVLEAERVHGAGTRVARALAATARAARTGQRLVSCFGASAAEARAPRLTAAAI
ncbi:MAG: hypothetical protein IPJ97_07700 [Proteobacteria bacterium]|nr:hypothetical protein [Pseudomonadota bacterium]